MIDLKYLLLGEKGQQQMKFIKVPFMDMKKKQIDTQTTSPHIL